MGEANGGVGASQISAWLRAARDDVGLTRRQVSHHLDVTERAIQNWEDVDAAPLPPADQFLRLVRLYKAERKLLVLLGNWELKKAAGGAEGRRSKAGGE